MSTGYPSIDKPWLKYYNEEAICEPLPECTIYEYLWEKNQDHLNDVALVYFCKEITYRELFENIDKVALAFVHYGIKAKDIVAVCIPNIPESVYIFYALNRVGAVCHFLDPRASQPVMQEHLNLAQSKLLITIPDTYNLFDEIRTAMGLSNIVVVDILQSLSKTAPLPSLANVDMTWEQFLSSADLEQIVFEGHDSSQSVCILHTGGTTGIPKGAILKESNFHSLVIQWKHLGLYYNRQSTLLSLMPPFVSFGLTANLHVPLAFGMKLVLIPEYNPAKTVMQIKEYQPNCLPASPAHWEAVYNDPDIRSMDLSFLKVAFIGGDTLNVKIERGLNEIFALSNKDLKIRKAYGMTETSTAVTMTSFDYINLETSVGIPLPQTTVGIFNENLQELSYNQVGEICVQSRNVMAGYYNNDAATAEALIAHKDGNIWLHTGDMGEITTDGILYIKGRIKRIIIRYDGIKIYPIDIETKILEHSAVNSCTVVGTKDPKHIQGDIPVAFIVLKGKRTDVGAQEQIKAFCEHNIIDYAVPQKFYFVDALPLTRNGKVDFCALEKVALAAPTENAITER